jgi:hypothetical protein
MMETMQLKIGEEVVVYARGRIRAMEEESIWDKQGKRQVRIKYSIDYPDDAGFARVTEAVIERAEVGDRNDTQE